jgi:cation:H+ antiporter
VSTAAAMIVFAVGLGVSLGASEFLVRGFGRLGANVGLAAGLVGLLTALGADAPEISSAITALLSGAKDVGLGVILGSNLFNLAVLLGFSAVVAGRVSFRRILLALDGSVALWATLIVGAMLLVRLVPVVALALVIAVFFFYVFLLAAEPHRVDHLPLPRHMRHRRPRPPASFTAISNALNQPGTFGARSGGSRRRSWRSSLGVWQW